MDQLLPLLIQLIGGAVGGNAVGAALKKLDLNKLIATISGIIGGIGGGQLAGVFDLITKIFGEGAAGGLLGNGAASAGGGAILTLIVGLIKKAMSK
ncbi:MAG: hypothetical protein KF688_12675 [Pirellulales bacterium]|nr:hypothetical protein [Pirellulales bacterium]MBX3433561.1 hypothetical protein [Pirellulales bacterium]